MILTPIALPDLGAILARFAACLTGEAPARAAFDRIAATLDLVTGDDLSLSQSSVHHRQAVGLARAFAMPTLDEPPTKGFTWDGHALRVGMEPSVVIHDVAHFQLCSPARRAVADFGLGAGPETGLRDEAETARQLFGVECELEEQLASLLGILWEAELGQPAILAFLEQNWLEGVDSLRNRGHFLRIAGLLSRHGFIDGTGRPTRALRHLSDAEFFPRALAAPPDFVS